MVHFRYLLSNMRLVIAPIALVSCLAFPPVGGDSNRDPVLGFWRLNEAKCQFSSMIPPVGVVRSYQPAAAGFTRILETRVIPDGQQILVEYVVSYDGKEYPIFVTHGGTSARTRSDDTVSFQSVDRHTVKGVFRNQGHKTSAFTRVVSDDGQRLWVRIAGIDSTGRQILTLLVYDRLVT
jgi:hypothetical protein